MSLDDHITTTLPGGGEVESGEQSGNNSSRCLSFDGNQDAKAVNYGGIARGAINMSNVYLANSLIHLACKASGGFDEAGLQCVNPGLNIYGMKPAALISNIAVAASILSALMMPLFGAIIDYTPHRKWVGIGTAATLTIVTGVQIGTVDSTWFAMAILQAIIFMVYQIQVMALFAYYPEIARDSGESAMNSYASTWSASQFSAQAGVNLIVIVIAYTGRIGTVHTAMVCQGLTMLFCIVYLTWCWYLMPTRPRRHILPKGQSLIYAGFRQNYSTFKKIWKNYKTGLRWFLISTIFGESSASAVGTTAVIFLNGNIKLSALQIGIFFEVSLLGVVFGTKSGAFVTRYTNPCVSLGLSELGLALAVVIGAWAVQGVETKELTYIWGLTIGFFLGWFYPAENLFFSMVVPKDQEAELSGFFGYSSQILGWLPPLVFTIMIESDINMAWALTVIASIFGISIFFLCLCGPWEKIVEEAQLAVTDFTPENESKGDDAGDENDGEGKNLDNTEPEKVDPC